MTCPKCNNTDKVIPIRYGLLSPYIQGDPGVDFELGSCIRTPCEPRWYCKRDTLHF